MFKKIITMMMVMVMVISSAAAANAMCVSEEGRPGIVGMEHIEAIIDIDTRYNNDEIEIDYRIEMAHAEGYWVVVLTGEADEYYGYSALGFYDHMPNEEEIDVLWANRMLGEEFEGLLDEYGF